MTHHHQRGALLLVMLLILTAGALWALLPATLPDGRLARALADRHLLAEGRDALMGHAALVASHLGRGPGFLPCPDLDGDGRADPCDPDAGPPLGRLPWRDLGLPRWRDSHGQVPWYAVSGNLLPQTRPLNSDTDAYPWLSADGKGPLGAVLIAPGAPWGAQGRPSNRPAAYLEGPNALPGTKEFFTLAEEEGEGNDKVMGLRREAVLEMAERRALAEGRRQLTAYYLACGELPWAAPFDPTASRLVAQPGSREGLLPEADATTAAYACNGDLARGWLRDEGWPKLLYYAASPGRLPDGQGCDACLILTGGRRDIPALLVAAGVDLGGRRPSGTLTDYFEGENATPGDATYERRPPAMDFNDKVETVELQ